MQGILQRVASTGMLVILFLAAGCTQDAAEPAGAESATGETTTTTAHDDHGGWWCAPHGVPEEVCGICSAQVAAEFQRQGDWCAEHDRPDSQCFICHPELEAQFAARYEAKYGKKPPQPEG